MSCEFALSRFNQVGLFICDRPGQIQSLVKRERKAAERAAAKGCARTEFGYSASNTNDMTRQQVLDLYFIDARFRLIELAAFLDRVDRAEGQADFRLDAFRHAVRELNGRKPERAKQVLLAFSDPTTTPIEKAPGKGAVGAWLRQGG